MGEQNKEQLGPSPTKSWKWLYSLPWPIKKFLEILFIVLITIIINAFITNLPIPGPEMHITKPIDNNTLFVIDYNKKGESLGVTIDLNIKADKGFWRGIFYESEFLQRLCKRLSLAPSIWVVVHNHDSFDDWIPYEEVRDLGDESGSASVTLYAPNKNWTIALVSLKSNDAQYFRGYIAMLKEINQFPRGKPFPDNGVIKDEIVVRTINGTLRSP
jgi:hypothetical protein